MNLARSLWASVQGDPVLMRRLNGWATLFWIAMIPISYLSGWLNSVTYVSALSIWALVSGHLSSWQAAKVEIEQQKAAEQDVPAEVVQAMVEKTNVESSDTPR